MNQNGAREARVDIVIPTYGRAQKIDATIKSILANSYRAFTLWVIDQGSDELTRRCVEAHAAADGRVRYVRLALDGSGPKRNGGALLGSAPFILFTNDDCLVARDWVAQLVAELSKEGTWFAFGRVLPGPRDEEARHAPRQHTVLALNDSPSRTVFEGHRYNLRFGQGHNMGVRRDRFIQVGGFDECLGSGGALGAWEDRDIGYRALAMGGRIIYTPDAVIEHCHWQSWSGVRRGYRSYGIGTGSSVAKYMRCGDWGAIVILLEWLFSQGLRQMLSGVLKHRNPDRTLTGLLQLFYPWAGFFGSLRHPIDRRTRAYKGLAPAYPYEVPAVAAEQTPASVTAGGAF